MLRITHQALLQCIDRAVFFSVSSLVFLSPGELMDGRRGLVPSNFVERVSDDDLLASLPPELTGDEALFQCTKPSGVPRGPSHLQFP